MANSTRWLARVVVLLCAAWYFDDSFWKQIPNAGLSDFRWYYLAAQDVARGESPYLAEGYLYPPLLACLLTPLAGLDYVPARWVWFLFSHGCLLAAAWLIWRQPGIGLDVRCHRCGRVGAGRRGWREPGAGANFSARSRRDRGANPNGRIQEIRREERSCTSLPSYLPWRHDCWSRALRSSR